MLAGKNRIAAVFLSAAVLAFEPSPDGIELVHGCFDETRIIGQDSCLKVSGSVALHSYPCTRQIGRTDIGSLGIENNNLEVNART